MLKYVKSPLQKTGGSMEQKYYFKEYSLSVKETDLEIPYGKLYSPSTVKDALYEMLIHPEKEHFVALFVNNKNYILGGYLVSVGTLNETMIHPRELFRESIIAGSSGIILAHNHPSGSLEPSSEDIKTTERLEKAGKLLGIPVIDHVICTKDSYYSMKEGSHI